MELAHLGELGLLRDPAGHVQLGGLRVEVGRRHADGQRCVHARRGSRARGGFRGDAAEGGGAEEVIGAD